MNPARIKKTAVGGIAGHPGAAADRLERTAGGENLRRKLVCRRRPGENFPEVGSARLSSPGVLLFESLQNKLLISIDEGEKAVK